jgi:hypothetical protein
MGINNGLVLSRKNIEINKKQRPSNKVLSVQDEDNSLKLDRQRQSLKQVGGPRPVQTKGRVDAAHILLLKCQSFQRKTFFVVKACAHLSVNNLKNSEIGLNLLPSNINLATCNSYCSTAQK